MPETVGSTGVKQLTFRELVRGHHVGVHLATIRAENL